MGVRTTMSVYCDKCHKGYSWNGENKNEVPTKQDVINYAREKGYGVVKGKFLCPDCKNSER